MQVGTDKTKLGVVTNNRAMQDMKMNVNAKAFTLLIDKLYSHKKEAVIRELCSNAADSHVMANKSDVPFDVTLPTNSNPTLVIRDYGIGLSKEDTIRLLGTVFESDNQKTNATIGGFGLGAKSPFALVNSYHVTSFFNGEKHRFLFIRDENDIPKLMFLDTTDTTEENGVEFTVVVDNEHCIFSEWECVAKKTLKMFNNPINFTNGDIELPDKIVVSDELVFSKSKYTDEKYQVAMGGVVYDIDYNVLEKLSCALSKSSLSILGYIIILKFNIGEIDVSPNREHIEYTEKSINAINNKVDSAVEALIKFEKIYINECLMRVKHEGLLEASTKSEFVSCSDLAERIPLYQLKQLLLDNNIKHDILDEKCNVILPSVLNRWGSGNKLYSLSEYVGVLKRYPRFIIKDKRISNEQINNQINGIVITKKMKVSDNDFLRILTGLFDLLYGKEKYTIEFLSSIKFIKNKVDTTSKNTKTFLSRIRKCEGGRVTQNDIDSVNKVVYLDIGKTQKYDNYTSAFFERYYIQSLLSSFYDDDILFVSCMTSYIEKNSVTDNPKWESFDNFVSSRIEKYREQYIKNQLCKNKWLDEEKGELPGWMRYYVGVNELTDTDKKTIIDAVTNYVNTMLVSNNVLELLSKVSWYELNELVSSRYSLNVAHEILLNSTLDVHVVKKILISKINNMTNDELLKFII